MIYNKHLIYSIIMYAIWSMATLDPTSLNELKIDINIQDKASPRAQPNHEADSEHISDYGFYGYYKYFSDHQLSVVPLPGQQLPPKTEPEQIDENCECGIRNEGGLDTKIAHGKPTAPNEYPWQVLLRNKKEFATLGEDNPKKLNIRCSGTLISTETVLTAAHCVRMRNKGDAASDILELVAGIHNIREPETDATVLEIKDVISHPESDEIDASGLPLYDSALILLSKPVEWTKNVKPICLPEENSSNENVEANVTVTGWGSNEKNNIQEILHEADLKILTGEERCKTEGQICASNPEKSACNGDSGGPLIKKERGGFYTQIGIVSGGIPCDVTGGKNAISMYCSVSAIMPFIKKYLRGTRCKKT